MAIELATRDGRNRIVLDPESALDIAAYMVGDTDLSPGDAIPSDGDPRIDHALRGFLFTCGPDHIRHPEPLEGVSELRYPLHGSLCGTRVRDVHATRTSCEAQIDVTLADGGTARLSRRWSLEDGGEVGLSDRLVNTGRAPFPPMMMYHLNLAGHLLDGESQIVSPTFSDEAKPWRFGDGESAHFCLPAAEHDGWSDVAIGPMGELGGRSLSVRFATDALPWLQMWRCQRGGANVVSIEPVSHRIAKRPDLAKAGEMSALQPGGYRDYAIAFTVR